MEGTLSGEVEREPKTVMVMTILHHTRTPLIHASNWLKNKLEKDETENDGGHLGQMISWKAKQIATEFDALFRPHAEFTTRVAMFCCELNAETACALRGYAALTIMVCATGWERRIAIKLRTFPLVLLRMADQNADVRCDVRQLLADKLCKHPVGDKSKSGLPATAWKVRWLFAKDLEHARSTDLLMDANTGFVKPSRLWAILRKVRKRAFPDSRENERYNSILKIQGHRAPSIGLPLLSSRLCLKGALGCGVDEEGAMKVRLKKSVANAEALLDQCLEVPKAICDSKPLAITDGTDLLSVLTESRWSAPRSRDVAAYFPPGKPAPADEFRRLQFEEGEFSVAEKAWGKARSLVLLRELDAQMEYKDATQAVLVRIRDRCYLVVDRYKNHPWLIEARLDTDGTVQCCVPLRPKWAPEVFAPTFRNAVAEGTASIPILGMQLWYSFDDNLQKSEALETEAMLLFHAHVEKPPPEPKPKPIKKYDPSKESKPANAKRQRTQRTQKEKKDGQQQETPQAPIEDKSHLEEWLETILTKSGVSGVSGGPKVTAAAALQPEGAGDNGDSDSDDDQHGDKPGDDDEDKVYSKSFHDNQNKREQDSLPTAAEINADAVNHVAKKLVETAPKTFAGETVQDVLTEAVLSNNLIDEAEKALRELKEEGVQDGQEQKCDLSIWHNEQAPPPSPLRIIEISQQWRREALLGKDALVERMAQMANQFGEQLSMVIHQGDDGLQAVFVHWQSPITRMGRIVELAGENIKGIVFGKVNAVPFNNEILVPTVGAYYKHRRENQTRATMPTSMIRLRKMFDIALNGCHTTPDTPVPRCIVCGGHSGGAQQFQTCALCCLTYHPGCAQWLANTDEHISERAKAAIFDSTWLPSHFRRTCSRSRFSTVFFPRLIRAWGGRIDVEKMRRMCVCMRTYDQDGRRNPIVLLVFGVVSLSSL